MGAELRAPHDDRAAGIIDAFPEEILPETALLSLQHVAQRLERPLVGASNRPASPAVVEQRVHRLLQHAHLVADNHARSEEHTSELQSQSNLVCRLLLEKKKTT